VAHHPDPTKAETTSGADASAGPPAGVVVEPPPRVSLWGPLHVEHDRTAVQLLGTRVAVALDRGRHPKAVRSRHPNEDVVAATYVGSVPALVVADGHYGSEAAMLAVAGVLDWAAGTPGPDTSLAGLAALVTDLEAAVARELGLPTCGNADSATTLVVAVVDEHELRWVSIGDSSLFVVTQGSAARVNAVEPHYLGRHHGRRGAIHHAQRASLPLRGDEVVVAVSDGVTDHIARPEDAIAGAVTTAATPGAAASLIIDLAGDAGAGDNVAVALAAPARPAPPLPWYVTEAERRLGDRRPGR
jgi:serine/threonine protein phosphatase PrpC